MKSKKITANFLKWRVAKKVSEVIPELGEAPKKRNRQLEGMEQSLFGQLLNGIYRPRLSKDLIYWTYSGAGEAKSFSTGVMQKRKGLQKGDWDYRFEIAEISKCGCNNRIQRTVYIEFKTKTGSLTKEQKQLLSARQGIDNIACYIAKDVEEGIKILLKEKVLI